MPSTPLKPVVNPSVAHEDRFADCVRLKLKPRFRADQRVTVDLDLRFADCVCDLETWRFHILPETWRFGFSLRGGELRFRLSQIRSNPTERNFQKPLPLDDKVLTKRTVSRKLSVSESAGYSATVGVSSKGPTAGVKASEADAKTSVDEESHGDELARSLVEVWEKGDEQQPKWAFQPSNIDGELIGVLTCWLADFEVVAVPYEMVGLFCTTFDKIKIREVHSPSFAALSEKRRYALERRMQKYVYDMTQDYFSRGVIRRGD